MIAGARDLEKLLTALLRPEGFQRDGRNWRLDLPDLVQVVHLQRSRWGENFYVNAGVFIRALKDAPLRVRNERKPNIVECHFRVRLEDLFEGPHVPPKKISAEQARLYDLLTLDMPGIDPETRETELRSMIEQRMLPFLTLCRTEVGILSAIQRNLAPQHMLYWPLRDRLGLKPPPAATL